MKRSLPLIVLILLSAPLLAGDTPKGFMPLFNGKDLTGWKSTNNAKVWGAEKGVIYCQGGGGGYLMTEKEYGDYELRLEYKMPKGGNSGVGIITGPGTFGWNVGMSKRFTIAESVRLRAEGARQIGLGRDGAGRARRIDGRLGHRHGRERGPSLRRPQ